MPISIINHDHTVGRIDTSNPLPVQVYGADGRVDIDDVGLLFATGTTAAAGLTALWTGFVLGTATLEPSACGSNGVTSELAQPRWWGA